MEVQLPSIVKNAVITAIKWDKTRGLTQWIYFSGDGWDAMVGGYDLSGVVCAHWMIELMDVLETNYTDERKLTGRNIRVLFDAAGKVQAIGHIIKEKWFDPNRQFRRLDGIGFGFEEEQK